ncbi:MAG: hypothetical protein P4L79_14450 [Legionella sp.]|uniref:hypothetical protein n=1 Tax=Legionella sp. TaxID=459 RepID=UPI00284DABCF|nr:hypothetical protein [Legionella sp.]
MGAPGSSRRPAGLGGYAADANDSGDEPETHLRTAISSTHADDCQIKRTNFFALYQSSILMGGTQ